MAATATARHIKHEHDKHGRGTCKAGLYLYLPVYYLHTAIIIIALKGRQRPTLLYSKATGHEASASLPQTDPS